MTMMRFIVKIKLDMIRNSVEMGWNFYIQIKF